MSPAAAAGPVSDAGAAAAANVPVAAEASARCENCGAAVTGRYCAACGQRLEPPLHSLWHFAKVATEDLTHADSRLWRTLGTLLFRPGHLTREFLAGRRARYLPPVRLYLVLSVAFFLLASLRPAGPVIISVGEQSEADKAEIAKWQRAFSEPEAAGSHGLPAQDAEQTCADLHFESSLFPRLASALRARCPKLLADRGRGVGEGLLHNTPRAMFVFLPLLAGVMMLMYRRPRHYYVEHLLLFVHYHAFVFLLLMIAGVVAALLPAVSGVVVLGVTLYITWYAYRSMRVVYGQSRRLTIGKLVVLSFFYLVSGGLMLALVSLYSIFTL
jgi:hypothetical protein